ncbi:MAG: methyl-accepting chemotaxis protein [Polyangiaceae bacterium]|jgi:nitrogen fixation/metabolism regulation signal transduction histidine kinase|nr:methyl-accepting chemotaxis protein [Polyangiaceae bacterium]MBK8941665.1 methyl-accepting chemotaxis protein [Polyangiaceae bacterium]
MSADQSGPPVKYKRSARNYLLDTHFQLKYTGFLVGITVALSLLLGALLWRASDEVLAQARDTAEQNKETVRQGQATVEQSQATVARGKQNIKLSDDLNKLVSSTMEACYPGDESLLESYKKSTSENDAALKKDQDQLELDKSKNEEHKRALEAQAAKVEADVARLQGNLGKLRLGFLAALGALVFAIGVAGIVFTHKIAGPIFKMKRLFRQIGEGKLVLREKLRKGDELQHFFESFESMVGQLRSKQQGALAELDVALDALKAEGQGDSAAAGALEKLRARLNEQIAD